MTKRHEIEIILSSRTAVFRCKQCRADFRTVDIALIIRHQVEGTLAEFYDHVKRAHADAPPTRTVQISSSGAMSELGIDCGS